jgi:hypothetical protein
VFTIVAAVCLAAILSVAASGCGPATPAEATRNFLKSIDTDNWNLFLNSILPNQVRSMTNEDIVYWRDTALKQAGESVRFNPGQLGMKQQFIGKDKNKAKVTVVNGKIILVKAQAGADVVLDIGRKKYSYKDPSTGKTVTQPFTQREDEIAKSLTEYNTNKYKGRWYVNFPLERPSQTNTL